MTLSDMEVKLYSKMNKLCCKAIVLEHRLNDLLKWDETISLTVLEAIQLEINDTLEEIRRVKEELHAVQD